MGMSWPRLLRAFSALLLAAGLGGPACSSGKAFRDGERTLPFDPATGVVVGAEPVRIERGRSRACLFVHGWISSPADFADLPEILDGLGWDVHAPLHPGHGTRPADLEGVTATHLLGRIRDQYEGILERYEEVVIIGYSMGGTVATILAAERPPVGLVLVAPFFDVTYRWYYLLPPRWWAAVVSPFFRYVGSTPEMKRVAVGEEGEGPLIYGAIPVTALEMLFEIRRRALEEADISRLTMPLQVIYSEADDRSSPSATRKFLDRVPEGAKRRMVFRRSGHFVFHDADREEAIAAITTFLRESAVPGGARREPSGARR